MKSLFRRLGSVSECVDGSEAVSAFEAENPDWVFMDVEMQHLDGFTAADQIRSRFHDAQIVFVTQYGEQDYRNRAASVGAKFVAKDEIEVLQGMIRGGFFQRSRRPAVAEAALQ